MKSKAFTLAELLAVIAVISIILVIAVPKIVDIIGDTKTSVTEVNKNNLKEAADKYMSVEGMSIEVGQTKALPYTTLRDGGYIAVILDTTTNAECVYSQVYITRDSENVYSYDADLICTEPIDLNDYNLFLNNNFASGTTNWSKTTSTYSVTSNIMTNVGSGTGNFPRISQTTAWNCITGHKIYLYFRARVTNSTAQQLDIVLSSDSAWNWGEINYYSITQNTWYNVSGIVTISSDYSGHLIAGVGHVYSSAAAATGMVMEVDGTYGTYALDLTEIYGAGNEPTKDEMDQKIAIMNL